MERTRRPVTRVSVLRAALQALLDRNQRLRGVLMAGLAQSITDAPTPAQALW